MIDAHAHLNASYTVDTVGPVVNRFVELGGQKVVDVTTCAKDLTNSQQIIARYPEIVYLNIGTHPESPDGTLTTWQHVTADFEAQAELAPRCKNLVGIGETGLDYSFWEKFGSLHEKVISQQKLLFEMHVDLAEKMNLPLVIHARGKQLTDYSPYVEILEILRVRKFDGPAYLHSYAGNLPLAQAAISRGYFLGVNGIATYANAQVLAEVASSIPENHFVLETDSPFLVPSNLERTLLGDPKVNEPMGIFFTSKRLAKLRGISTEQVLELATANAKRLFVKML